MTVEAIGSDKLFESCVDYTYTSTKYIHPVGLSLHPESLNKSIILHYYKKSASYGYILHVTNDRFHTNLSNMITFSSMYKNVHK